VREFVGHGEPTGVTGVAFSGDGKRLVTSSRDADARTWDVETGEMQRTFRGHSSVVSGVAFSDDGCGS
jgi:WD40 repeat protein